MIGLDVEQLPAEFKKGKLIYFILSGETNKIKIGFTTNLVQRFSNIKTSCPTSITLLAIKKGSKQKERELHKKFATLRDVGEWFRASPELMGFISMSSDISAIDTFGTDVHYYELETLKTELGISRRRMHKIIRWLKNCHQTQIDLRASQVLSKKIRTDHQFDSFNYSYSTKACQLIKNHIELYKTKHPRLEHIKAP